MSVACQKRYTLTVQTPITVSAYWAFEETTVQYVDKVAGYTLQPAGFAWTGTLDTVTGKILKGARLQEQNGPVNMQQLSLPAIPPGFPRTALEFLTSSIQGWSVFYWINYSETIGNQPSIIIQNYNSGIHLNGFNFSVDTIDDTQLEVALFVFDGLGGTPSAIGFGGTLNAWNFVVGSWDKATQKISIWINAVLVAQFIGAAAPINDCWFHNIGMSFGSSAADFSIIDEMGVSSGPGLTQAQVNYLYNAGAGRTWPL